MVNSPELPDGGAGRYSMWIRLLGEDHARLDSNARKIARRAYAAQFDLLPHQIIEDNMHPDNFCLQPLSLGNCTECTTSTACVPYGYANKKEEPMRTDFTINATPATPEFSQAKTGYDHVYNRLCTARWTKVAELQKTYGMTEDAPTSLKDMLERIKAGAYTVKKGYDLDDMADDNDDFGYDLRHGSPFYAIRWNTKPEDKAGYKAAEKLMEQAYSDAQDTLAVSGAEAGLKALREFEAMSFSVN